LAQFRAKSQACLSAKFASDASPNSNFGSQEGWTPSESCGVWIEVILSIPPQSLDPPPGG